MSVDPRIIEDPLTRPLGAAQRFGDTKRALQTLGMKAGQVSGGFASLAGPARTQYIGLPSRAGRTGTLTVASGIPKIPLDSISAPGFDLYGDWDITTTFRWTAPQDGAFQIFGTISATAAGATATTLQAAIYKNGGTPELTGSAATASAISQPISSVVSGFSSLSSGDYLELYAILNGSNLTIVNNIASTSVSIMQIA